MINGMSIPNDANAYLPGVITIPSSLEITNITQAYPMVISTSVNTVTSANTYREGQLVKLVIPYEWGMQQANGMTVKILSVIGNDLIVEVDSRGFDPFTTPSDPTTTPILGPAGANNLEFSNLTNRVPFQSLNNIGN